MSNLYAVFAAQEGIDERSAQMLVAALEKSNLQGFDYLEFKQSLNALAKLNMDEPTAFRSAFATAAVVGLTKEKLIETARFYKKILTDEKAQFEQALRQQVQRQIAGKEQEAKSLAIAIEQKEQQIQRLTQEVAQHKAAITAIQEQLENTAQKINATKANFDNSLTLISSRIDEDLTKIQQYL